MDSHGRVFYIDHNTRSTTWQRPTSTITDDPVEEHRRQLDRRLHFIHISLSPRCCLLANRKDVWLVKILQC